MVYIIIFFLTYSHLLFSGSFSRIFLYSPLSLLIYLFPTRHTYFPTPFHHFSDFLFYFLYTYIPRFPSFFIFLVLFVPSTIFSAFSLLFSFITFSFYFYYCFFTFFKSFNLLRNMLTYYADLFKGKWPWHLSWMIDSRSHR